MSGDWASDDQRQFCTSTKGPVETERGPTGTAPNIPAAGYVFFMLNAAT